MKKLRGFLSGFMALSLIAGLAASNSGCRRKYKLPPPAFTLTAAELYKEFKDPKAAEGKYLGKSVEISGLVDSTGVDSADQPYVAFKGDDAGSVQCFFSRSQADEIAQIPKGKDVALRGVVLTKVIHVALDNCEFVKK